MSWTDERVETLTTMWTEGKSASQIAKELGGVTRNAVIGKVHRLGLSNRVGGVEHPDDDVATPDMPVEDLVPEPAEETAEAERPAPPAAPRPQGVDAGRAPQAGRPAAAAAACRFRDQRRGAGQPCRGREEGKAVDADAAFGTHLQVAGRRSRHRRLLVLRPARRCPASPTARPMWPSRSSRCPPAATAAPEAAERPQRLGLTARPRCPKSRPSSPESPRTLRS